MDADAKILVEVSSETTIPACGSSSCCSAAADAATEWATDVEIAETIAACGSSFCSSSAADAAMAVDAAASYKARSFHSI